MTPSIYVGGPEIKLGAAQSMEPVVPSDTARLPNGACRGLYVGSAGNITVVTMGNEAVTMVGAQAGVVYPVAVLQVKQTGTTAGSLLALY